MKSLLKRVVRKLVSVARGKPKHGMTNLEEQRYYRHYAQRLFKGEGEMVDLGCWLGSTTLSLAAGLEKNRLAQGKGRLIHAYDIFIWESWMDPYKDKCFKAYAPGESFLDEYNLRVRRYAKQIKVHQADLTQEKWSGQPIELLLVDAMKSEELAQAIVKHFYPSLIPGISFLLHQDFKHWYTPWIHQIQYELRDYFELEHNVRNSCSIVFRLKKKLDLDVAWLGQLPSWSAEKIDAAFAYSLAAVADDTEWYQDEVRAAKIMYYVHTNRIAEARAAVAKLEQERGTPLPSSFGSALGALAAR